MWIWYVSRSNSGSVSSIVATARKYGINTVMIKSGDGRTMWSQFNPTVVQELHASGLHVCAWQYVYGNFPLQEANVGATAVRDGADCLIIDAESEYEGKYIAAQSYITQLRNDIGQSFPVALAGFPYVDYHPGFPYSIFLGPGGAQYNTPQMYWVDIGTSVNTVYAHTYAYNSVYQRAIDPLGQVYENPPLGQLIRFRQLSRTYGAAGVSWWDWQEATNGGWKGISIGAGNLTGVTATPSTPIPSSIRRRSRRVGAGAPCERGLHDPDRRRLRPGHSDRGRELPDRQGSHCRRNRRAGDLGGAASLRSRSRHLDAHRRGDGLGRGRAQLARHDTVRSSCRCRSRRTRTRCATRSPAPAAPADRCAQR